MGRPLHEFECEAEFESERAARVVYEAVLPDLEAMPTKRSEVRAERRGNNIQITILAEDIPALRASVTGTLRLLTVSENVLKLLEGGREDGSTAAER